MILEQQHTLRNLPLPCPVDASPGLRDRSPSYVVGHNLEVSIDAWCTRDEHKKTRSQCTIPFCNKLYPQDTRPVADNVVRDGTGMSSVVKRAHSYACQAYTDTKRIN